MRTVFISLILLASIFEVCGQNEIPKESQPETTVQAIPELLAILEGGNHSPELYAQLGYSYYQEADLAHAVLYYEKALKLKPRDKDISDALDLIRNELSIQITEIPDFVLSRYYRNVSRLFSSTSWSVIQLLCGALLLGLIYLRLFKSGEHLSNKWAGILIGLTAFLMLLSVLFASARKYEEKGQVSGIAMSEHGIYEAPDDRSELIVSIGPGNKVFLIDEIGEWYKVLLRDKDTGWIPKDQIKLI